MKTSKGLPEILNAHAEVFLDSHNQAERRDALRTYLWFLLIAAKMAYPSKGSAFFNPPEVEQLNSRPLQVLDEVLRRIDDGEIVELFRHEKKKGGQAQKRLEVHWFAVASAVVTILMRRFKKSERNAAKLVIDAMRIRGLPHFSTKISKKTSKRDQPSSVEQLIAWRDSVMSGRKSKLARAWYDEAMFFADHGHSENGVLNAHLNPAKLPGQPIFQ